MNISKVSVAVASDCDFIRKGIAGFISSFRGYEVVLEAKHESTLIKELRECKPQICLVEVRNKKSEQYRALLSILRKIDPDLKIIGLLTDADGYLVRQLVESGINSLLLEKSSPSELQLTLDKLRMESYYYPDFISDFIKGPQYVRFSNAECLFLSLCCSELTYKEIADKMELSLRAVESMRMTLFKKLDTVSRTGLILKAIKKQLITI